jgi:predicted dehydrogenase
MNWLVVGAGDIAKKRVIPAILSDKRCRVAAVCDLVEARARELAAPCGARAFTDFAAALADPAVEAVYLSTPVCLHAPQAVDALRAGKHVLVEKPLGLNAADAQRVVDAAAGAKGRCGVAYFRRFTPRHLHLKNLLAQGALGQVVLVRMCYFSWFNPDRDDPKYWRVMPERGGGGPLSDMGTHMFDLLIDALGMPTGVQARVERLTHLYTVEDSAVMTMKLPCGAQVDASFHWNSKTWSHEFEVVGTEAKVKWHPYDSGPVALTVGRETKMLELPGADNVHAPLIAEFVDAVASGRPPAIPPAQALLTNRLLDAVYKSAWEKSVIVP